MNITVELVQELIDDQFPEFSDLEIRLVENCGNDNRTFHLGDTMAIRLPSGPLYASQIEKEIKWLPELKPHLSLSIPSPIVKGEACDKYPFNWSINGLKEILWIMIR